MLLDVDAVAADAGDVNRLVRFIAAHRGALVVVSSSGAALSASIVAALDHTARVARVPRTDMAVMAWQPKYDALNTIVGRPDTVAILRGVLDDLAAGRGPRVLWIYGGAGSGKSHVCNAFAAGASTKSFSAPPTHLCVCMLQLWMMLRA